MKYFKLIILEILLFAAAVGCGTQVTTVPPLTGSLEIKNGFYVLRLRGTPEEMGRAHGTLLKTQIADLLQKYLRDGALKKYGISWPLLVSMAKNYESGMPEEFKAELRGIAEGSGLSYEEILLGQVVMDLSVIRLSSLAAVGCSGFIAKGKAASNEALVHGANIEWEDYDNSLRDNLAVIYYEPSAGNKFVALSYAGGAGVLIGMNEKQIASSISAISAGTNFGGIATLANLRKMLQYSNNLTEAANKLTASDRTCGYTVPVSCGSPEGFFVMELSPTHFSRREAGTLEVLVSTNHFISEEMQPYQTASTEANSARRYATLLNLVMQNYGLINASLAKIFMSDKTEPHGDYINSDLVIYSTILSPGSLTLRVAKGPVKSESDYVSFSLEN
ncbi:hypothetical protein HZB08_01170 [Candidatus Saganbacteria bacterium]|uniref:Peptidase C45 hydrolase domain-containing protein n=1 Tax=Candidatus Saganbacteria bacterium TaxID=2575572 RepID=A0A9D6YXJ6_UNCSA|nr:hypothetical protein [Candidatus Saganbacteria bacterium]